MKKLIYSIFLFIILLLPFSSFSRGILNEWYIKDFQQEIVLNPSSTALITEKITADCGSCYNKHGIFRIMPTRYKVFGQTYITPVELVSITDFADRPLKYKTINDYQHHTITWKIGDPNKTVQGLNYYKIVYQVKNVFITDQAGSDRFYWNLLGNFWQLEVDNFRSTIKFPEGIDKTNLQAKTYTGTFGSRITEITKTYWEDSNLIAQSSYNLGTAQGITLDANFPKGFVTRYNPSFWERNRDLVLGLRWLIFPLLLLIFNIVLWFRIGREPDVSKTVVPEFDVPEKLSPIEIGMVYHDGGLELQDLTASMIYLAVNKVIKIEKIEKKIIGIIELDDYRLDLLKKPEDLPENDKVVVDYFFQGESSVLLSAVKKKRVGKSFFGRGEIKKIEKYFTKNLVSRGLLKERSSKVAKAYIIIGAILFAIGVEIHLSDYFLASMIVSAIIMFIFAYLLRQRTKKGLELYRKIQGFKMFMEKAEKYRQQFFEKEDIFEKLLPYAIVFGLTKKWIKKMNEIYGRDYYNNYTCVWLTGVGINSFDANNFNNMISNLSRQIGTASGLGSSGGGGGGGAGGGGGGGGGGGW